MPRRVQIKFRCRIKFDLTAPCLRPDAVRRVCSSQCNLTQPSPERILERPPLGRDSDCASAVDNGISNLCWAVRAERRAERTGNSSRDRATRQFGQPDQALALARRPANDFHRQCLAHTTNGQTRELIDVCFALFIRWGS